MFKAVLFDVDGTLLDTSEFIVQAMEHTIKTHNLPPKSRTELQNSIGHSLIETYQKLTNEIEADILFNTHTEFQAKNLHLVKSFPNIIGTLSALKKSGLKLAAITNRTIKNSVLTLEQSGMDSFFDLILSREDILPNLKPHPHSFKKAMKFLKVKASETIAVGDSIVDVHTARAAGIKVIIATYGYGTEAALKEKPDHVVSDLQEIIPIITS